MHLVKTLQEIFPLQNKKNIVSRIRDVGGAADHVRRFPRPCPCILQAIKHWRCRRPGAEAYIVSTACLSMLARNVKLS